jgi:CDP-glycerol glycerophosphotransferase
MKVDKKNPRHWFYLLRSGIYVLVAITWRMVSKRESDPKRVVLYGHKFNGNIKALADYCRTIEPNFTLYFATLDPVYYEEIADEKSIIPLSLNRFRDVLVIGKSDVIVTDHGLHTLVFLLKLTSIKFADVWHGIAYKGFTAKDFNFMHPYDEVWVSSPVFKDIYVTAWGFKASQVFPTGYGRVDRLVRGDYSKGQLLKTYGIDKKYKKIVLVAPTWKQDDNGRSILPFGADVAEFLGQLNETAKALDSLIIFRAHLNSDEVSAADMSNTKIMPYATYPQIEEFLFIADIVVSDWSSLLFDYLPLHRPTIFLDVLPPFRSGLTLGKEYRFGEVVESLDDLVAAMRKYIVDPVSFSKKYARVIRKTEKAAYGDTLDGEASKRYYQRLQILLQESS